jgi:hypothetical protein
MSTKYELKRYRRNANKRRNNILRRELRYAYYIPSSSPFPCVKVKVKESRNRPGVAQRIPGGLGSQIFMTFGT